MQLKAWRNDSRKLANGLNFTHRNVSPSANSFHSCYMLLVLFKVCLSHWGISDKDKRNFIFFFFQLHYTYFNLNANGGAANGKGDDCGELKITWILVKRSQATELWSGWNAEDI